MIEFVTLDTLDDFSGNPIAAQHRLRHRAIIKRQNWDVPQYNDMEFDSYDNPAAKYLVYRDEYGIARGVSRFYPTSLPYMLEQHFSHFFTAYPLPKSDTVWEGSRFCIDKALSPDKRRHVMQELVVAYLETALHCDVTEIVGLMYPAYWKSIFMRSGWPIEFTGDIKRLDDGNRARAARLPVSQNILAGVRAATNIRHSITTYGEIDENQIPKKSAA